MCILHLLVLLVVDHLLVFSINNTVFDVFQDAGMLSFLLFCCLPTPMTLASGEGGV